MSEGKKTVIQPSAPPGYHEASGGDRGDAGSNNLAQSEAIGQDDPQEGSRMGREANKKSGFPGAPHTGTNAAQDEAASPKPGRSHNAPCDGA